YHSSNMCLHLAPVGGVDIRRQHHYAATSGGRGSLCHSYSFARRERSDTRNDRHPVADSIQRSLEQRDLLVERKRLSLTQRTKRHRTPATGVDQPAAMLGEKAVVDAAILVKSSRNCRDHPAPCHVHLICSCTCCLRSSGRIRLPSRATVIGGRTES